jgi:uncharacterized alpha/beta hydrolase family protein
MNKTTSRVTILIITLATLGLFVPSIYGQNQSERQQLQQTEAKPLPVLLVHGYAEDAAIWKKWEDMLRKDGIQYFTVTFKDSDDKCGSAKQHANLYQMSSDHREEF